MTQAVDFEALAARCEAATGPDRELEWAIFVAVHPDKVTVKRSHRYLYDEQYTRSLDAAMTLVPEGMVWSLNTFGNPPNASGYVMNERGEQWRCKDYPATPALALCAASLRACAA